MFITIRKNVALLCSDQVTRCIIQSTRKSEYFPSWSVWCCLRCSDFNPASSRTRVTRKTAQDFSAIEKLESHTVFALSAPSKAILRKIRKLRAEVQLQVQNIDESSISTRIPWCTWVVKYVKPSTSWMKWAIHKIRKEMLYRREENCEWKRRNRALVIRARQENQTLGTQKLGIRAACRGLLTSIWSQSIATTAAICQ